MNLVTSWGNGEGKKVTGRNTAGHLSNCQLSNDEYSDSLLRRDLVDTCF
jgi:hypothetical protein